MYTGIVQGICPVVDLYHAPGLLTFTVDLGEFSRGLKLGASVSVSGVCLTVVAIEGSFVVFEAMQETLDRTTLGGIEVGDEVNTERSARVGDEIGGHVVSGHVTGTAMIVSVDTPPNNVILRFRVDPSFMPYILPKGFIALDGASLTVVDVVGDTFTAHLIPETLARTTFARKKIGDDVNLELDAQTVALVSTVKRILGR
jgi:riboflavin synthase